MSGREPTRRARPPFTCRVISGRHAPPGASGRASALEAGGQAELGEQLGIEEVVDPVIRRLRSRRRTARRARGARSRRRGSRRRPGTRWPGGEEPGALAPDALTEHPGWTWSGPRSHSGYGGIESWRPRAAASPAPRCRSARRRRRSGRAARGCSRRRASRSRRPCRRGRRREGRPGPLERAVDRRDRRVEQLGDLARLPPQHLAQDEHRALAGRQVLEGGDERQPDGLAGRRPARPGRRRSASTRPSAIGPHPRVLGQRRAEERCRPSTTAPRSMGRARRWRAREHVEADVGGDAVEPGPQRRAALEAVEPRARPGPSSPGRRPRPRSRSRASGSSSRSAPGGGTRAPARGGRTARFARSSMVDGPRPDVFSERAGCAPAAPGLVPPGPRPAARSPTVLVDPRVQRLARRPRRPGMLQRGGARDAVAPGSRRAPRDERLVAKQPRPRVVPRVARAGCS